MRERLLKSVEVAFLVGVAPNTLEIWYRFKRENPDNEFAKMLPAFIQAGGTRQIRYWKETDIEKIILFKESIPHGRAGLFGSITRQNEYKKAQKEKEKKDGSKKGRKGKQVKQLTKIDKSCQRVGKRKN